MSHCCVAEHVVDVYLHSCIAWQLLLCGIYEYIVWYVTVFDSVSRDAYMYEYECEFSTPYIHWTVHPSYVIKCVWMCVQYTRQNCWNNWQIPLSYPIGLMNTWYTLSQSQKKRKSFELVSLSHWKFIFIDNQSRILFTGVSIFRGMRKESSGHFF